MLAFYNFAYIPLHVFVEGHTHGELSGFCAVAEHHADADREDDRAAHPVEDHALQFIIKAKGAVVFVAVATLDLELEVRQNTRLEIPFPQAFKVPDEPIPAPLQPR